jgi:hypothetical protein
MDIIIFKGYWTVQYVRKHSNYLFIFGDNDIRKGKKGQAIIRGEPNSIGVPTKKISNYAPTSYYYDYEFDLNVQKIDEAIEKIKLVLKNGKYCGIILPEDGLGTGLANLKENAPKTLAYLNSELDKLKIYVSEII